MGCVKYFERMAKINMFLEMEIGITGGEEDGVDNTGVKAEALYTKPEQVWNVYKALSAISPMFSIAAAFGNVHGVYKAGNVVLSPHLLADHQAYIKKQINGSRDKPNKKYYDPRVWIRKAEEAMIKRADESFEFLS